MEEYNPTEFIFLQLLDFIHKRMGHKNLDANKKTIISTLRERTLFHQIDEDQYIKMLDSNEKERELFINLVTINETYFFREARQFQVVEKEILSELKKNVKNLNIWSVTCSTGEEAISLAMIAEENWFGNERTYTVYASDINTSVLNHLKEGKYGDNSYRLDGKIYSPLLFKHSVLIAESSSKKYQIHSQILRKIKFFQGNLIEDDYHQIPGSVHIAFFRNTLIYFAENLREKILEKIANKMVDGGYLFLSASEIPWVASAHFKVENIENVYFLRKISNLKRVEREVWEGTGSKTDLKSPPSNVENIQRDPPKKIDLDISLFLENIRAKVNQKVVAEQKGTTNEEYESLLKLAISILEGIQKGQISQARLYYDKLEVLIKDNALLRYFDGTMHRLAGDEVRAIKSYRHSLQITDDFWPAHYYLAMLLKEEDTVAASKEFGICVDLLSKEIQRGDRTNEILFDFKDFDEKYILDLCKKWINKLAR